MSKNKRVWHPHGKDSKSIIEAYKKGCASEPCIHVKFNMAFGLEDARKLIESIGRAIAFASGDSDRYFKAIKAVKSRLKELNYVEDIKYDKKECVLRVFVPEVMFKGGYLQVWGEILAITSDEECKNDVLFNTTVHAIEESK